MIFLNRKGFKSINETKFLILMSMVCRRGYRYERAWSIIAGNLCSLMQLTKVQFVENRGLVFWMHDCMVYMCLFCPEHGKKLRGFTHGAGWWVWARYRWHLHKLWSSSWGLSSWYIPRLAIGWQNFLPWYWFARLQSLQC